MPLLQVNDCLYEIEDAFAFVPNVELEIAMAVEEDSGLCVHFWAGTEKGGLCDGGFIPPVARAEMTREFLVSCECLSDRAFLEGVVQSEYVFVDFVANFAG